MSSDSSAVDPGDSTYSLRKPDSVSASDIPQMPMERVLPRQTSTGLARGIQQLGSPNVYVDSGNEQIVVAKTDTSSVTTPQVLMGNQVNKGEGFFVTKPGINVTTAKNDSDFIFNSNQNVFKIIDSKTAIISSFAIGNGTTNYALIPIPHGQTFTPIVQIYVKASMLGPSLNLITTSYIPLPIIPPAADTAGSTMNVVNSYYFPSASSNSYILGMTYGVDATNIYINVGSPYGTTTPADTISDIPVTYFLLQETASPIQRV